MQVRRIIVDAFHVETAVEVSNFCFFVKQPLNCWLQLRLAQYVLGDPYNDLKILHRWPYRQNASIIASWSERDSEVSSHVTSSFAMICSTAS